MPTARHWEDPQLIHAITEGSERDSDAAMQFIFHHPDWKKSCRNFVLQRQGQVADFDDIWQETMITLHHKLRTGEYRHEGKLSTFIYGIVKYKWLNSLRKNKPALFDNFQFTDHDQQELATVQEEEQELSRLWRAVKLLSDQCKHLIKLRLRGHSHAAIAEIMGYSNGNTVKTRYNVCKKNLRRFIQQLSKSQE